MSPQSENVGDEMLDSDDSSSETESVIPHLSKKELKEGIFRLELAKEENNYRKIMKCKTEVEYNATIDGLQIKTLKIFLKCAKNVFLGQNSKKISIKQFKVLKNHESHLVKNLSGLNLSKLCKKDVKDKLKSVKLPIFRKLLKMHKKLNLQALNE